MSAFRPAPVAAATRAAQTSAAQPSALSPSAVPPSAVQTGAVPPSAGQPSSEVEGYVLFRVGGTTFAVSVLETREVIRAARLELLPSTDPHARPVALVDTRGRSVPVVDLRTDRTAPGDVVLPMWRVHVGLVVDRVEAVLSARDLVLETADVPESLPSYARGLLRPAAGGAPVLLIGMPDAAELELDAARTDEPRLGQDVLGADAVPEGSRGHVQDGEAAPVRDDADLVGARRA